MENNETVSVKKEVQTTEKKEVQTTEIVCLVLMIIPIIAIIGFILYLCLMKPKGFKLAFAIISIFVGFQVDVFLWLDAYGKIKL